MKIAGALKELWDGITQVEVAERLARAGDTDVRQPTVSAWMRGQVPSFDRLELIETTFGKPKGWILTRAGFVDPVGLLKDSLAGGLDELRTLSAAVEAALAAAKRPARPRTGPPRPAR